MSTETTNKKIKIDNGTTFGRTYTDKAVDELLKNVGGGGGISVIELTDKNGTIASAQLGKINASPQNFSFKYNGKILLFTSANSTTYQYCNNTTNSSENNVMTTSTLLTITSSTGAYTIAENVNNVVANSIHPANGGDLTSIQVGSKVYSIPSGGEEILNVSVSMTAEQLSQSINNSGVGISYTEENKTIVYDFIKAQKGIMRLTVNTPVGNLCMTLRPSLWKDDIHHSYNFEGSLYIETDLSAIGAKYFNQIIVRAICWDTNNTVAFRPTIIPIGDN